MEGWPKRQTCGDLSLGVEDRVDQPLEERALEHGLDVVNADMQTMMHLKENFTAAATSADYFDIA